VIIHYLQIQDIEKIKYGLNILLIIKKNLENYLKVMDKVGN
jgi:hypothetical protein